MYRSRCRSDSRSNSRHMLCCTCPCRSPQKLSFSSLTKCWKCSVIGVTFAMGVSLLFKGALASQAKANLHPLAFYTIEVTSPNAARTWRRVPYSFKVVQEAFSPIAISSTSLRLRTPLVHGCVLILKYASAQSGSESRSDSCTSPSQGPRLSCVDSLLMVNLSFLQ
jgi:hypothetical protein